MIIRNRTINSVVNKRAGLDRTSIRNMLMVMVVVLCSMFILSCNEKEDGETLPKAFFDLTGFIEKQISTLRSNRPVVSKVMKMGTDSNRISSRDIDWKKELELFIQSDINKPAYRLSYAVTSSDSSFTYTLKKGQDLPVKYLHIQLDKPDGLPVLIEALLQSENKLYISEKNIKMILKNDGGHSLVLLYQIHGFQKLATMEKKPFDVTAQVSQSK